LTSFAIPARWKSEPAQYGALGPNDTSNKYLRVRKPSGAAYTYSGVGAPKAAAPRVMKTIPLHHEQSFDIDQPMKTILACFFAVLAFAPFAAYGAPYQLTNLGPEFRQYVEANRNKSADERWTAWKGFEGTHAEFFRSLCNSPGPECESKKKLRLETFFNLLPTFEAHMWTMFDAADEITAAQVTRFKEQFPDLADDTPIVFMPSILGFNGRATTINGKVYLLIAPDIVAVRQDDLNVLFTHEFFHIYQFGKLEGKKIFYTMGSNLWFEGFATWVSIHLNEGTSNTSALMDPKLAAYCGERSNLQTMAKEFSPIAHLNQNDVSANQVYLDWFTMGGTKTPTRQGYCLGLTVIRELAKSYDFHDLLLLDEEHFLPLMDEALASLQK
jgi:hypothetical protein